MSGGDGFWLPVPAPVLDWVSVVDHGAVGDGTTNDTAAIQAAVDATPAGGVCYFPVPAVEYKITAAISVPHSMALLGPASHPSDTEYGAVVQQATANTSAFIGPTTGSDHWSVEGLTILGIRTGQTAGAGIESSQSIHVKRCRIDGFQDGLRVTSTSSGHHSYYSTVSESWFDSATRAGVRLVGIVNNFTMRDCRANSNGTGLQVVGGILGLRVYGGGLDLNSDYAIDIDGDDATTGINTAGVLISGVYMEQASGDVEVRLGNTSTVYAVRIESCQFIRPSFTGGGTHIVATNVDGLTIEDCFFSSTSAVSASSPATGVVYGRNYNMNAGTVTLPAGSIRLDEANVTPAATDLASAVGTSHYLARADHVHDGTSGGVAPAQVRDAGRWEAVVSGNPAAAVTTPSGDDWIYGWITA